MVPAVTGKLLFLLMKIKKDKIRTACVDLF